MPAAVWNVRMVPPLFARAGNLVGSVLDRRKVPLGVQRWPELSRHLHSTPAELLDTYWPLRAPGRYHLDLSGVRGIAESDTSLWLIRHDLLQIGSGPDGTFVVVSNDDRLEVKYVSMQESISLMDEGGARPPAETIYGLGIDVFDVLRHLEWMAKRCIDGAFPDDLEMPIPLDFYEAVRWRAAKDERDP